MFLVKMPVISTYVVCKYRFTYVDCLVKCDGCSVPSCQMKNIEVLKLEKLDFKIFWRIV